jgi:hypothetical protein
MQCGMSPSSLRRVRSSWTVYLLVKRVMLLTLVTLASSLRAPLSADDHGGPTPPATTAALREHVRAAAGARSSDRASSSQRLYQMICT